jgi:thioredoxin reductase
LAARATEQAIVFGAEFVHTGTPTQLAARGRDRALTMPDGSQVLCSTVIIATGVSYRRLPVPGLDELTGAGVFYGTAVTEARAMRGRRVFVIGGANSAGRAAVHLARFADSVTLVVRGESLATGMSTYLVREVEAAANIDVRLRTEVLAVAGVGRLDAVTLRCDGDASTEALPADAMFILIGAEPRTEWLAGRSCSTIADSSLPAAKFRETAVSGRSNVRRPCSSPACPAFSRRETYAMARPNGSHRPWARERSPSHSCTGTWPSRSRRAIGTVTRSHSKRSPQRHDRGIRLRDGSWDGRLLPR